MLMNGDPAMTDPVLHLRLAGSMIVALGIAHAFLPAALDWSRGLATLSLLDRQIAYVHSAYIGLTCVLLGLLPLALPDALVRGDALATAVLIGLTGFWGSRLVVQLCVYDTRHWRGDRLRTAAHLGLVPLWTYETAVYGLVLIASGS
jgi:hypothetical protein